MGKTVAVPPVPSGTVSQSQTAPIAAGIGAGPQTHVPRKSWQRRKQARPGEILDAALEEFSANGFEAAHMGNIAQRADITKGTIYLYFTNKEAVFATLVHERIGTALVAVAARVTASGAGASDKLKAFFPAIGACLTERSRNALLKVIFAESHRFPELAALYRNEIVSPIAEGLTSIGEDGGQNGLYRLPAEHIAQLCIAPALLASLGQFSSVQDSGADAGEDTVTAAQLSVVLRGCLVTTGDHTAA